MAPLATTRLVIQVISAGLAAALLVLAIVLYVSKPKFRAYLLPVTILLVHMLAFAAAQLGRDLFGLPMPIDLTDWSALQRFHVLLTLAIYIVWMPLLRR